MTASRRISFAGFVVAAVGLIIGASAFACSGQGFLSPTGLVQPAQSYAGSKITVAGTNFAEGPVVIKWDNQQVMLETKGPSFSVAVTIPTDARPGPHYVIADQGERVEPGRMYLEVLRPQPETGTGGGPVTPRPDGVVALSTDGSPVNPVVTPPPGVPDQSPTPSPVIPTPVAGPSAAPAAAAPAAPAAPAAAAPAQPSAAVPAGVAEAPIAAVDTQPVAEPAPTTPLPASSNPAAVTTNSGEVVFGGSLSAPAADPAQSSPSTAGADVWSGLKSGPRSSLSGDLAAPSAGRSTSTMAIGIGLLSVGLVVMAIGFGVAEMTRRRALAVSESDR